MLGRPDRIEAERLNELAHVEGVIHIRGVRDRRRAIVVLPQQTFPVTLVVAGHHHPTVHACAPLPESYARCAGRPLFEAAYHLCLAYMYTIFELLQTALN